MRIPFFNLKANVKIPEDELQDAQNTLLNLWKISQDNDKKIDKVILTEAVYRQLILAIVRKGKKEYIYDMEIKRIPDIAVIWEKDK